MWEDENECHNFFFGNAHKNSELAFILVDKRKADKKEIKYLWLSLVCFFSLLLLGLNIFNYVFTLNRVSLFLREATQTGGREGGKIFWLSSKWICVCGELSILLVLVFGWVEKKKNWTTNSLCCSPNRFLSFSSVRESGWRFNLVYCTKADESLMRITYR